MRGEKFKTAVWRVFLLSLTVSASFRCLASDTSDKTERTGGGDAQDSEPPPAWNETPANNHGRVDGGDSGSELQGARGQVGARGDAGALCLAEEKCDGMDNNCNGDIDDIDAGSLGYCDGHCGMFVCDKGVLKCQYANRRVEECNGIDDDCDGAIDELEDTAVFCPFNGPLTALGRGECRIGMRYCVESTASQPCESGARYCLSPCLGEVTPSPEACNNKDDDCDGRTDNGYVEIPKYVLLGVDTSGSMGTTILEYVVQATSAWLNGLSQDPLVRIALAAIPGVRDRELELLSDFTTPDQIVALLGQIRQLGYQYEPSLDFLRFGSQPNEASPIRVSWGQGRHIIIMFSDEEPQSYTDPNYDQADAETKLVIQARAREDTRLAIRDRAQEIDLSVIVFTGSSFVDRYQTIIQGADYSRVFALRGQDALLRDLTSLDTVLCVAP